MKQELGNQLKNGKGSAAFKGIYSIELYTGEFIIKGSFIETEIATLPYPESEILWDEAELIVGLGDLRGFESQGRFKME